MEYMTAKQAAQNWGISDRRVRVLCSEGKIAGAVKEGYAGAYWDYVQEIAAERGGLSQLVKLNIFEGDVAGILREAGFTCYRYDGALQWIIKAMELIRSLG